MFRQNVSSLNSLTKPMTYRLNTKLKVFTKDIYLLFGRELTEFYSYKWRQTLFKSVMFVIIALIFGLSSNSRSGQTADCIPNNKTDSRSCLEVVDNDFYVEQNFYYMYFTFWTFSLLQVVFTIVEKVTRLSIFTIEHHNSKHTYIISFNIYKLKLLHLILA